MTLKTKHYYNLVRHNGNIACLEESHLYCRVLIATSLEVTSVQNLETPIKLIACIQASLLYSERCQNSTNF